MLLLATRVGNEGGGVNAAARTADIYTIIGFSVNKPNDVVALIAFVLLERVSMRHETNATSTSRPMIDSTT